MTGHPSPKELDDMPTTWEDHIVAYLEDDNIFWYLSSGHHMNMLDICLAKIEELEKEIESLEEEKGIALVEMTNLERRMRDE